MAAVETTGVVVGPGRTYAAAAANQGRGHVLVQGGSDGVAAIAAAANAAPLGIQLADTINAGDPVACIRSGEAVAVAGAAVAAGQFVNCDNQGRVVPTAAAGDNIVGQALCSATNAGDWLVIEVNKFIR